MAEEPGKTAGAVWTDRGEEKTRYRLTGMRDENGTGF